MSAARVLVIDIGSNSVKSLVAEAGGPRGLRVVSEHTCETRLGTGLGGPRPVLREEAMEAVLGSLRELLDRAAAFRPQATLLVATSAVRDSANGPEFRARVRAATGQEVRLLSGEEEAAAIGRGVMSDPALPEWEEFHLCDLGGGSLELVHFRRRSVAAKVCLPLGAVRLLEQCVPDPRAPFTEAEVVAVRDRVERALQGSGYRFGEAGTRLVGTGGGATHARLLLARSADPGPHGVATGADSGAAAPPAPVPSAAHTTPAFLPADRLARLRDRIGAWPLEERRRLPGLPAERADIMPVALTVLGEVLRQAGAPGLWHSFHNLRYGLAAELLQGGGEIPR